TITPLAPSLNAFIFKETWIQRVAGVSFPKATLTLHGSKKFTFSGPFLFTHTGITGPAVFSLSSLSAYEIFDQNHPAPLFIDLMTDLNFDQLSAEIHQLISAHPKKIFVNILDMMIPKSLAEIVCRELHIEKKHGNEISKSDFSKITQWLKHVPVHVVGRASGEEFVTAGGIDLSEVDSQTLQSKICPNLYFAGEILDIDGFTGGFNLQSAWATGRLAGIHLSHQ
ncbi:aminoacetone oxidase family FAD-binding enzyme, partial [Candidatus Peregrinibacteria bacterium]|nr:aminoacetone oxidase family FAD-binding enzyme [Candidatus Peregrinibacteria bacterium]